MTSHWCSNLVATLSTRQESYSAKLYDSLDLTLPVSNKNKNLRILVFESALSFSSLDRHLVRLRLIRAPERYITETHLDRISLIFHAGMHHGRDMVGLFVRQNVGDMMQIISILTALAISFASLSKNAATLERDARAIATLNCKLLEIVTKVEAVLDVEGEAKFAKRDAKTYAFSASAT